MSFDKKLAKAMKNWKKAKERKPSFENVVTDGVYTAKLVRAEMGESQGSGRLQVSMRAVIAGGEYKGENVNWYLGLETEDNIMFFQRDLVRLGKEVPDDPTDLEDVLKELEDEKPTMRIQLRTKGEFQNVRILKLVGAEDEETESETEEEAEEPEEEESDEEAEKEAEEPEEDTDEEEKTEDSSKEDEEEEEESEEEDTEDEEAGDDEVEAPEVEVGSRVMFSKKGKDIVGTVKSIDYKKELVKIKDDAGVAYYISPDALSPAPKTKVKKSK